jgi:hypothetical protein
MQGSPKHTFRIKLTNREALVAIEKDVKAVILGRIMKNCFLMTIRGQKMMKIREKCGDARKRRNLVPGRRKVKAHPSRRVRQIWIHFKLDQRIQAPNSPVKAADADQRRSFVEQLVVEAVNIVESDINADSPRKFEDGIWDVSADRGNEGFCHRNFNKRSRFFWGLGGRANLLKHFDQKLAHADDGRL